MNSILDLNKDNVPFVYSLREMIPGFIFNYDVTNKPEGRGIITHILRSTITFAAYSVFILAGLVEKAVRFTIELIQKGIDKAFTKQQQEDIKKQAKEQAKNVTDTIRAFYNTHFAPLFG